MNYIAIIILIGLLILIHETGHFSAAKFLKIPIARFSIGFGPKLWGFKRAETEYRLSIFPIGGYVMPEADDIQDFYMIPWARRLIFSASGPAANIFAALIGFSILNLITNGVSFNSLLILPFKQMVGSLFQMINMIPMLFSSPDNLSGILGIVAQGGRMVENNALNILVFSIMLNINLAIINLLPIPPLDGGNITLYLFEKIHPKALKLHLPLALSGWILLIGLMVYSTILDVARFTA